MIKIGIDDSNYSPSLAGPCIVAAYTQRGQLIRGVKDSKALTPKQRIRWYKRLADQGDYAIAVAMPSDIARLGIYEARNEAAKEAVNRLTAGMLRNEPIQIRADTSLWCGIKKWSARSGYRITVRKGGDGWVWAASIFAKVNVDAMFYGWGRLLPQWGPDFGRGNVRAQDARLLLEVGPTPFHRVDGYGKDWWNKLMNTKKEG